MKEILRLLKTETEYRRLLLASFISGTGDWFNNVALFSLLLRITGSGLAVGLTLAVRTLPYLVMGPVGGILTDKWNRKTILVVSDFARALLALSFLWIHDVNQVWIAYAGTLALVVFSALFSPARTALIPQLVTKNRVARANGLEQSTSGLVMAVGSALGGIIAGICGVKVAFVLNSVSFLASGILCWSVHLPALSTIDSLQSAQSETCGSPEPVDYLEPAPSAKPTFFAKKLSIWNVLRQSRLLQIFALLEFLWPIGGGAINVLVSVYGYQVFHSGNFGVGELYGSLGIGFLLSGFLAHRFVMRIRQAAVIGFITEGLCHVLASQSPNLQIASIFLMLATLGAGVGNASIMTLIMQTVTEKVYGRIFALLNTISSVTIAFSMMAAGALLSHIPARTIGLGAGLFIVLAAITTGIPLLRMKLPDNLEWHQETSDRTAHT